MLSGRRVGATNLYRSYDRTGPEMLRVAGCAMRLHLLVERGAGKSTRDLQIFSRSASPGKQFLAGRLPGLHEIVERAGGFRQVVQEIFAPLRVRGWPGRGGGRTNMESRSAVPTLPHKSRKSGAASARGGSQMGQPSYSFVGGNGSSLQYPIGSGITRQHPKTHGPTITQIQGNFPPISIS